PPSLGRPSPSSIPFSEFYNVPRVVSSSLPLGKIRGRRSKFPYTLAFVRWIEVPQCSCGKEWTTIHALSCLGSPAGTMLIHEEDAEDEEMAERTLTQVTNEIEAVRKKILDAEATIQAQREKLTELVREMTSIQSETLSHFGMRLVLESTRDGYPIVTRRRGKGTDRETSRAARAWAQETGWRDAKGRTVGDRGQLPPGLLQAYKQAIP